MYDLIIIGLGGMGSAALYQAAKRGAKVLGIDRFSPPHENGSSHAETRVTRLAVGEGAQYIPLVARAHEIWGELEQETGQKLLYQPGGYIICPQENSAKFHGDSDGEDFVTATQKLAQAHGIKHELVTGAELRARHPRILVQDRDHAIYEPTGGYVLSEAAVATQIELAIKHGATVRTDEPVTDLKLEPGGVTIKTAEGSYHAERAIVSAGAWVNDFLPQRQQTHFKIYRQIVYWFEVEEPADFDIAHWPFLLWLGETLDQFYGSFSLVPGGVPGLKMLTEQYVADCDPNTVTRKVTPAEIEHFYQALATQRLAGITPTCIKATACLYTNTPDEHFVLDQHPETDRVLIASPCSGHGFKHSAAIGESLVQWALEGQSQIDLSAFKLPL